VIYLGFVLGKILRGEDAPLAAELENWLKENPGKIISFNNIFVQLGLR